MFLSRFSTYNSRTTIRSFHGISRLQDNVRNTLNIQRENDNANLKITVEPLPRKNETIEVKRARLIYQSRKRGILETDLLLSRFAKKYLKSFTLEELEEYDKLLDMNDWDIYYWATKNYAVTPMKKEWENSKILKMLQDFSENKEKEILRMPKLD